MDQLNIIADFKAYATKTMPLSTYKYFFAQELGDDVPLDEKNNSSFKRI